MRLEKALRGWVLELLDDGEVRRKVREIITAPPEGTGNRADSRETTEPAADWNRLIEEHHQLTAERDRLAAERNQLTAERNSVTAERDRLTAERNQLSAELNSVTTERNQLAAERNRLKGDRDRLTAERDRLAERCAEAERRYSAEAARTRSAETARLAAEQKVQVLDSQTRPFRDLLAVYNAYRAVPGQEWKRILPDTDPVRFLSVGCQRETVTGLWDALRDVCEGDRPQEWETLLRTLRYLCDRYNSTMSAPVWSLMEQEQGHPYQDARHTRSSRCSRYHGTIQRVLLPGIWNNNRNQAERKTVVYYE